MELEFTREVPLLGTTAHFQLKLEHPEHDLILSVPEADVVSVPLHEYRGGLYHNTSLLRVDFQDFEAHHFLLLLHIVAEER